VFPKVVSAARVIRENASARGLVQQEELRDLAGRIKGAGGIDKLDDVARYLGFRSYSDMISNNCDDG
jgi:hypothetical protein